jgi:hypothetical protein
MFLPLVTTAWMQEVEQHREQLPSGRLGGGHERKILLVI